MEKVVRILVLESAEADYDRTLHELMESEFKVVARRVADPKSFERALEEFRPDMVLADYMTESCEGLAAMRHVLERWPNLPFIFVSHEIHEASVIEALKLGATDYVFKEHLSRLTLSVHRALREADEMRELAFAHQKIQKSEEYFRSLIENATDLIAVLGPQGEMHFASPSVRKVMGYDPKELVGKNLMDFVHPQDMEDAQYLFTAASTKSDVSAEFRFLHQNGSWRGLEAVGKSIVDEAGELRLIINARDITDRLLEQEALKESIIRHLKTQTELQKTQQQIIKQERMAAIGQMASGIAHDFSNALMPVLGFSEILLSRSDYLNDPARVKQYLELINTSARDAMHIVGRLREFYRTKDKVEDLNEVNLSRLVEQVVGITQPKWKDEAMARGAVIQAQTELGDVPGFVGNEGALREALTNLIFNAVDAMPGGGVLLLKSRLEDEQIVLEISDTGGGMSEEVARRCFEPFFSTKGKGGTGLGLSMVYGIVRRHDGTIDVKSKPGQGTTFVIKLPVKNTTLEKRLNTGRATRLSVRPLKILVVDDEPLVRQVMREYLANDGHEVETAVDGKAALEVFPGKNFDLVITDRAMPEMNGDQLAEKIKQLSPKTPVIMLTGFGELMKAKGEQPAGVDRLLSKPITIDGCRDALAQIFSEKAA